MNHYDVRSTYSKEAGLSLANVADKNIAKIIAIGAGINNATEAASYFGSSFDDEVYTADITIGSSAGDSTDGAKIVAAIYSALQEFDEKDITGDKVCVLPPAQYYALLNTSSITGATWLNKDVGGSGSVSTGTVPMIGGVKVMMSNHIPSTDESSTSLTPNPLFTSRASAYKANFTGLKGLIFTKDAAATVKLLDLGVESEYQIDRQGTLMVAKYAMGHNVLRPACAIKLVSA